MTIFEATLSNATVVLIPAVLAILVARFFNRPAVVRTLWLLVFLKLLTPPLAPLPCVDLTGVVDPVANGRTEVSDFNLPPTAVAATDGLPVEFSFLTTASEGGTAKPDFTFDGNATLNLPSEVASPAAQSDDVVPFRATVPITTPTEWIFGLTALQGLTLLWLVGAAVYLIWAIHSIVRVARLVSRAESAPKSIQKNVSRLSQQMGLRRQPQVKIVPGILTPMVFSPVRNYLLLPESLVTEGDQQRVDSLIVHELAHLHSGDHWVRRLEIIVTAIYWWHPILWLGKQRIREAEEQICDAWVVSTLPGVASSYASTLVDFVSLLSGSNPQLVPVATGLSQFRLMKRRIAMIMQGRTSPRLSITGWLAMLTVTLLLIPAPTIARPAPQETKPTENEFMHEHDDEHDEGHGDKHHEGEHDEGDHNKWRHDDDEEHEGHEEGEGNEWRERRQKDEILDGLFGEHNEEIEHEIERAMEELAKEIRQMNIEIKNMVREARSEISEKISEAPDEIQRALLETDVERIVNRVAKDTPKHVRLFLEALDVEGTIDGALDKVEGELDAIELDPETVDLAKGALTKFFRSRARELSRESREHIDEIRQKVQREIGSAPEEIRNALRNSNVERLIERATRTATPVVREIVDQIDYPEIVQQGLRRKVRRKANDLFDEDDDDGDEGSRRRRRGLFDERELSELDVDRREILRDQREGDLFNPGDRDDRIRRDRDDRDGRRDRGDRDETDSMEGRYRALELRLDRLMNDAQLIRREMRNLRRSDERRATRR